MSDPSTVQIAQMRSQRTASFRETCNLTPAVADGITPVTTAVKCAVNPAGGGMDGGGTSPINRRARFSVSMVYGTVIKTGDRFTWNGKTLEIAEVRDPKTNAMAVHADCIEIRT